MSKELNEKVKNERISRKKQNSEPEKLERMLAAVLNYLADDDVEVIDLESLLNTTEGLREWWNDYQEKYRKKIEEEIKQSLANLSFVELQKIKHQINEHV